MRKSKFTEAQIVAVLQEGVAGMPVAEILRKHGISRPTYFNWKSKYGGTSPKICSIAFVVHKQRHFAEGNTFLA